MATYRVNAQHIANQEGLFEPQRSYNYMLVIHDLDEGGLDGTLTLSMNRMPFPYFETDPMTISYMNEVRYVAGKSRVSAVEVQYRDYVDSNTARVLIDWYYKVYNPKTGAIGYARDYKKKGSLFFIGPDGSDANSRVWDLQGIFPLSVNPGEGSMESNDQVMISCRLSIDIVEARFASNAASRG